jgi:DNA-binding NtrC family response regulator
MTPKPAILLVDDSPDIHTLLGAFLQSEHYEMVSAYSGEEALRLMNTMPVALVLMDVQMPKMDGLQAMRAIKAQFNVPVIIITGAGTLDIAVKAMQQGAFDYITKPFDLHSVREVAQRALLSSPSSVYHSHTATRSSPEEAAFIGTSKPIHEVFKLIGLISTTSNHTSVLLCGESGTGKEVVARSIHTQTCHITGREAPFIGLNCTAIPDNLLESELFGSERGAFTGATQRRMGKFEAAQTGTIFLDEIGDLSLPLQAKLLRVIQERMFERVGGNDHIPVMARFIAATHRNLQEEVRLGRFREDLFYRLNVAVVNIPPLRERKEDIVPLAMYFLSKHNKQMQKAVSRFSDEALAQMKEYHFPGNVRELENMIERAVMLTAGNAVMPSALGIVLPTDELLPSLHQAQPTIPPAQPLSQTFVQPLVQSSVQLQNPLLTGLGTDNHPQVFSAAREQAIAKFEQEYLRQLLRRHRGNVSAAADESQMSRQNFHRLMQKYGITADQFRGG